MSDRSEKRGTSPRHPDGRPAAAGTRPHLYQRAFEIMLGQIADGTLRPGMRLSETQVAKRFGISRAPARQALEQLEREGMIEKSPGRGYVVRRASVPPGLTPTPDSEAGSVRLTPTPSWARIYSEVETEIVARTSFATWRINETELARYYDVSRTVARDVLGRLQQRGVIRKDDRSRWFAPGLTPEHVDELYELRWLLEPVALVHAMPNVPPGFIASMRASLEHAIAHARGIDGAVLDELEEELHVRLLDHCDKRILMQAIKMHQSLLIAHRFLYRWTPRLFDTEPFLPEHMQIVERLESGHVHDAAHALEHHLKVSRARAVARVEVIAREFDPEPLPYLDVIETHSPGAGRRAAQRDR